MNGAVGFDNFLIRPSRRLQCMVYGRDPKRINHSHWAVSSQDSDIRTRCSTDP